jgi:hypothetical protein
MLLLGLGRSPVSSIFWVLANNSKSFKMAVPSSYTEHGHKLRILKIRDNIVKIEKVVKRLRND